MEYFVTSNLNHDGREYKRGDTISFGDSDSAAKRLLAVGVIQTGPIGEAPSPAPTPTEPEQPQPAVAGKPLETGEPSIDGQPERGPDHATDITPGVAAGGMRALSPDVRAGGDIPTKGSETAAEPTLEMTRIELENLAFAEGVNRVDVDHAPNKAALIDLILENRKSAENANTQAAEPEIDPSANL